MSWISKFRGESKTSRKTNAVSVYKNSILYSDIGGNLKKWSKLGKMYMLNEFIVDLIVSCYIAVV